MVDFNPNAYNVGQKFKMDNGKKIEKPDLQPITLGDNNIVPPKCEAIGGGSGTADDPYILDGNDMDDDIAYMQTLANKHNRVIHFRFPGHRGKVTPD